MVRKVWKIVVGLLLVLCLAGCASVQEEQSENTQSGEVVTGTEQENTESVPGSSENDETEDVQVNDNPRMAALTAKEVVAEMRIGWNLGNTMDSTNSGALKKAPTKQWETAWGNPVTSEELIDTIIGQGFNVIRIPVSWVDHLMIAPDYEIEEKWMARVKEIVDYAYSRGAYVILNTHHEGWYDPYYDNQEAAADRLVKVWSQIAEQFKDYDEHLIFEGMNEPRKRNTPLEWNGGDQEGWDVVNYLNSVFIDTIRSAGGNNPYRCLMIPGYAANCTVGIKHLEVPADDNKIIVSVHAYEPYNFALNVNGTGVWNHDVNAIDNLMRNLEALFLRNDIPVIIGEMGAMHKPVEGNEEERAAWAEYYISKAKEYGVPCVWWDNGLFEGEGELFGLIDRETYEWKYQKVVDGLFRGLE